MTLIECFTASHIDNIAACLRLQPEKLILAGSAADMEYPAECYVRLLRQRGQNTRVELCDMQGKGFDAVCSALDRLVREEAPCVIDLTGGEEPVILAAGAVLAGLNDLQRQNVRVEKWDRSRDMVLNCISGSST